MVEHKYEWLLFEIKGVSEAGVVGGGEMLGGRTSTTEVLRKMANEE